MSEHNLMKLRDWEILLRSIENGNCVLLLGPDLDVTNEKGDSVNLRRELALTLQDEFEPDAPANRNFSLTSQLFENATSRDDLEVVLSNYYQTGSKTNQDNAAFAALASLPFQVFLSLRHDNTLRDYLTRAGRTPKTDHYDFTGDRRDTLFAGGTNDHTETWATVDQPLIYNLLGSLDTDGGRGSAVITESDHIRFLEAVVSENPKLPNDLTNYLKDKNFLFIGFGMQNFYLRILLHVLNLARSTKSFAFESLADIGKDASNQSPVEESVLFFQSTGFNTLKIMESDPTAFLTELAERWKQRFPDDSFTAVSATVRASNSMNKPSVFVSYVKEDEERATTLARYLEAEGLEPWIDHEGLRVGSRWNEKLEDVISSEVDFFIVLQSKALASRRESYVHLEVTHALERQRLRPPKSSFIFPVVLDADAERLDAIQRVKIQSMDLNDLKQDSPKLAKEIRREHARWQKR